MAEYLNNEAFLYSGHIACQTGEPDWNRDKGTSFGRADLHETVELRDLPERKCPYSRQ